jgi:hypothetical protein
MVWKKMQNTNKDGLVLLGAKVKKKLFSSLFRRQNDYQMK